VKSGWPIWVWRQRSGHLGISRRIRHHGNCLVKNDELAKRPSFSVSVPRAYGHSTLACDELGCLPIDENGAGLLFQSSATFTRKTRPSLAPIKSANPGLASSTMMPPSPPPSLASLLHHAEGVIIEGKSYCTRNRIKEPEFHRGHPNGAARLTLPKVAGHPGKREKSNKRWWRRRELNPRPWQTNQPRLHA
jgi:hypothetical protein